MVGTCPVTGTAWQTWGDATCSVSGVSGKHDLYLKFTGGSGYLFNISWFKFIASPSTATPIPSGTPVISADLNHDGSVNMADVILIATVFNSVKGDSKYVEGYDLNTDDSINMSDVMIIAAKFNTVIK